MVNWSSSKRILPIRIRLAVKIDNLTNFSKDKIYVDLNSTKNSLIQFNRVNNLIGKGFSCRENRYRIKTGLTRLCLKFKGKVAIGKARYLLNIVYYTLRCSNHLFSVFKLLIKVDI